MRRNLLVAWCIGLVISLAALPLSLFGRDCLRQDNSIISYSMMNRQTDAAHSEEDYSHLTLYTKRHPKGNAWEYGMTIITSDGKRFSFSDWHFNWSEDTYQDRCLEKMLEIKALFPSEAITIKGEKSVDTVAKAKGLNEEQTRLLHSLFSAKAAED